MILSRSSRFDIPTESLSSEETTSPDRLPRYSYFLRDPGEQRGAELHALAIILEDEIFRNFFLQILSTTLQLSFPVLSLSLSYLTDELARKRDAQLQKASSP